MLAEGKGYREEEAVTPSPPVSPEFTPPQQGSGPFPFPRKGCGTSFLAMSVLRGWCEGRETILGWENKSPYALQVNSVSTETSPWT